MIRVSLAVEPPTFDEKVRRRGLDAIAELTGQAPSVVRRGPRRAKIADRENDIPVDKFPPYWREAIEDLLAAYNRICSYVSCYIEPVTGAPTVDHMLAKSTRWDVIYEWHNYRLASQIMNARKNDRPDIFDPFEIEDSWFGLDLTTYQVFWQGSKRGQNQQMINATLDILNKSDCIVLRESYVANYLASHIDIEYLKRRSPFVARELRRQGTLRPEDV